MIQAIHTASLGNCGGLLICPWFWFWPDCLVSTLQLVEIIYIYIYIGTNI